MCRSKPPFQVSRRGWGEFPAKLTLQFAMPDCNRPVTLEHTIKLDRNYTGLQTLGKAILLVRFCLGIYYSFSYSTLKYYCVSV